MMKERKLAKALVQIARGKNCKGPLAAREAQRIAKDVLTSVGLDWVGHLSNDHIMERPNGDRNQER